MIYIQGASQLGFRVWPKKRRELESISEEAGQQDQDGILQLLLSSGAIWAYPKERWGRWEMGMGVGF